LTGTDIILDYSGVTLIMRWLH